MGSSNGNACRWSGSREARESRDFLRAAAFRTEPRDGEEAGIPRDRSRARARLEETRSSRSHAILPRRLMPVAKPISLSKSKLNAYHQCKKRLWLEVHRRDLLEASAATSRIFAVGQQVGSLARAEHADGILVPDDLAWSEAEQQTQAALAAQPKRPVFEAAVSHASVCVRSDLLIPRGSGFHLAEVKSTTSVKDYHLPDAAVQVWVLRGAGVAVKSVELRHINREFVYPGNQDYRGLFTSGDIQDAVEKLQPDVPKWVKDAQAILGRTEPDVAMGSHCDAPFECPLKVYCASLAGP